MKKRVLSMTENEEDEGQVRRLKRRVREVS